MTIDNSGQVLTLLSIGAVVLGVLFYLIDTRLNKVLREFQPNGGQSMRDQLNRIEAKIDGHINWHMSQKGR